MRQAKSTGERFVPESVRDAVGQLGANIAAARMNRRWRQEDLARRAGLTRRVVMRIESGHLGVSIAAYVAVLRAMGLDSDVRELASAERDLEGQTLAAARSGKRVRLGSALDDEF